MKYILCFPFLFTLSYCLLACGVEPVKSDEKNCSVFVADSSSDNLGEISKSLHPTIPKGAQALINAYPDFKFEYRDNKIFFSDSTFVVYDDGREKDFQQQLDESDVEDMFAMPYDTCAIPGYLHDGGRSRCEELYKKMYGASANQVRKMLTTIDWFGQKLSVTKVNGVDKQLKLIADEIAEHPNLIKYASKSSGTFYWRPVRGAKRLSAHSYGFTIDVNTSYSNYWQWTNSTNNEKKEIKYENRIPKDLVEIFQRHGFIWGGYWYHYDTMHFEYRPEILIYHGLN